MDNKKEEFMTLLELAYQTGLTPKKVSFTAGGEFHSACPLCGGTDRFYIQPYKQMAKCLGFYCCRRCGVSGDAIQFAREFLNYSFSEAMQAVGANIIETILPTFSKSSDFNPITLQQPSFEWIERATNLVMQAHENLLHNDKFLSYLTARGLPLEAVKKYKLGWIKTNQYLSRNDWGLDEQLTEDGRSRSLWIPKGLIIPLIEKDNKVRRLKVRRSDWKDDDKLPKYVVISGSMNGLSIINNQSKVVIVVESELDAYAIDFVAHELVNVIAIGSNIKNPDNIADHLAKNAKQLLICYDNDKAGKMMLRKWQKLYPHAQAFPTLIGKDVGEAIQLGLDIKNWIFQNIKT